MALNTLPAGAFADDAISSDKINLANNFAFTGTVTGAAKIGQVIQTVVSDKIASTSTSFTDITGCSVSITPTATSSKILIQFVGSFGNGGEDIDAFYQILRGSTVLQFPYHIGDGDIQATRGNRSCSCTLLDSPSTTSAVTFKAQFKVSSNEIFLNRNGANDQCGFTTITVSEILA
jgi:hypothetical protein